jgi:hypothetical protein
LILLGFVWEKFGVSEVWVCVVSATSVCNGQLRLHPVRSLRRRRNVEYGESRLIMTNRAKRTADDDVDNSEL